MIYTISTLFIRSILYIMKLFLLIVSFILIANIINSYINLNPYLEINLVGAIIMLFTYHFRFEFSCITIMSFLIFYNMSKIIVFIEQVN